MASHKGWDRHLAVTSVATTGGSFFLGRGQLGLIDLEAAPTAKGLKITNSLAGMKKDSKLQLRVGKHPVGNNRSQSSKDWSSQTFKLGEVLKLEVDAPKEGILLDEFIIGYDGLDADTAIVLTEAENEEISINLEGSVIGALGFKDAAVEVKLYLEQPNAAPLKTMEEIVETAVEQFNRKTLMGDIPITTYVEAVPVNSENIAAAGTDQTFYSLTLQDEGDSSALGLIQSQYDFNIEKTDRIGLESVYTVIQDPIVSVTTTNFVVGVEYIITTVGDTDFAAIGASANTVGVTFVATGVGGGTTGVADTVPVTGFTQTKAWKVKGCAACPAGYTQFTDGYVYSISIEDDGADSTAAIEAISVNTEAGSAVKVSVIEGFSTYTVVVDQSLSQSEIDAFIVTNPEAEISLVTENAAEICSPDNTTTTAWVAGDTCKTKTEAYSLVLADDECGSSRLAEVKAAYPELTIVQGTQGGCQTTYDTTVITNLVCEGCSDFFRALFTSEAPQDFDSKSWTKAAKVYSGTALMGIKFKAKPVEFSGSEVYRDDMPYLATSARISIAGGHERNINESFLAGTSGRMSVTLLSIGAEPENWGGDLRPFEDMTRMYQEGVGRHEGNNYAKWILGEETLLKANMPYVDYILTVRLNKMAQSFSGELNETMYYHFLVEPGVHVEVESLLNTLAAAAGVETVQAYAKDA